MLNEKKFFFFGEKHRVLLSLKLINCVEKKKFITGKNN